LCSSDEVSSCFFLLFVFFCITVSGWDHTWDLLNIRLVH
jgi:hypothetical protein